MEYFVLGEKLPHTHSPAIHAMLGNPEYGVREMVREDLPALFSARAFRGINVTIPYKQDVMPLCDTLDGAAIDIGAVNTVVNCDGKLFGCNTDFDGIIFLCNRAGIDFTNKKVLILGSGGTSKTAAAAAKRLGARTVIKVSRTGEVNYENVYTLHADADILLNTTSAGMFPNNYTKPGMYAEDYAHPIELSRFANLSGVVDVVYNPLKTQLICEAEALGIPAAGGLTMLAAQAAFADQYFRGVRHSNRKIAAIAQAMYTELANIVLIGMPGCGKTSVGRLLAKQLGRELYDLDKVITERAGKPIPEIFAEHGEAYFRDLEAAVTKDIAKKSGVIIACGGGTPLREENRNALRQNGRIVYIKRPLHALARNGRPLSAGDNAIEKLYAVRRPIYESFADCTIEPCGSVRTCAAAVRKALKIRMTKKGKS